MSWHTCPKCGAEDAIEMKMEDPPEPEVNAGATFEIAEVYCDCKIGDFTADQCERLEHEAAQRESNYYPDY